MRIESRHTDSRLSQTSSQPLAFSLEGGLYQVVQASFEVTVTQSGLQLPECLGIQACTTRPGSFILTLSNSSQHFHTVGSIPI